MKKLVPLLISLFTAALAQHASAQTLVSGGGQWKVRQVNSTGTINTLVQAQNTLDGFNNSSEASEAVDLINYGEGASGNFNAGQASPALQAADRVFPNLIQDDNNHAVLATCTINVTTPGDITFGINGDDLARLSVNGSQLFESAGVGQDAFGTINLAAGNHDVEVLFVQGAGAGDLEVFIANALGTFDTFGDGSGFELLVASGSQNPTDITPDTASFQVDALAGSAVANLAASGGAGSSHSFRVVLPLDLGGADVPLVPMGADWNYLDEVVADGVYPEPQPGNRPPAADWNTSAFDDSGWPGFNGGGGFPAPLGYADASIATTINFIDTDPVADGTQKNITSYFRHVFTGPAGGADAVDSLRLLLNRDDGAVVYINGVEVLRTAMPEGVIDNDTTANNTAGGLQETTYFEFDLDPSVITAGNNLIAVEVHQANVTSSDQIFDLQLDYKSRTLPVTDDGQHFTVVGNQLVLSTDAASIPGIAVSNTYDVTVRATNECGTTYDETIEVTALAASGSAPTDIALSPSNIQEGLPAGTKVGDLSATDADAGDLATFQLVDGGAFPDNAGFSITGSTLWSAMPFDADAQSSYSIRVRATDQGGNNFDETLTVTVDPAPAQIALTPDTLPLNAIEFSKVGTLTTSNFGTSHTYQMTFPLDPTPAQLINFGDTWSYLADGSDQGTAWTGTGFDDSLWASGPAPLGYGVKNEPAPDPAIGPTTTVDFGPDDQNKYATTYFRTTFNVADPRLVEALRFELAVDDGAVIHVNGNQWFSVRADNVDSFDDYTGQGDGGEETNDIIVVTPVSGTFGDLLVAGANTIAIEVHQSNGTSSDLWLDLDLQATVRTPNGDSDYFYLMDDMVFINREVGDIPGATIGSTYTFEVQSTSNLGEVVTEDVTVTIGAASSNSPTDIALSNASVDEVQPAGTVVGTLSSTDPDGGSFTYSVDNAEFGIIGDQLVTAGPLDFDDGATRSVMVTTTDNTGLTFTKGFTITVNPVSQPPTAITLTPASFAADAPIGTVVGTLDAVDGNAGDTHTFTFGTFPQVPGAAILPFGSTWKYDDSGLDLGTGWKETAFNDTLWASGPAELGYGDGDEATETRFGPDPDNANNDPDNKFATTYFRHTINIPTPASDYQFNVLFDDAAIVYINGTEVWRSANLPAAPAAVAFDTYATATGTENGTSGQIAIPPGLIVAGDNLIAVEIHQASATSSDISFDFELSPFVPSPYPTYFTIVGDEIQTAVDFSTTGITPPFTFDLPIVAEDPDTNTVEQTIAVMMVTDAGDTDMDTLPDSWEEMFFGAGNLGQGPGDDPDNDGRNNKEELEGGTDPTDPNDYLQITDVALVGGNVQITWPAKAGFTYSVFSNTDLGDGNWVQLGADIPVAVDGDQMATDTGVPVPGARQYRVESVRTPAP